MPDTVRILPAMCKQRMQQLGTTAVKGVISKSIIAVTPLCFGEQQAGDRIKCHAEELAVLPIGPLSCDLGVTGVWIDSVEHDSTVPDPEYQYLAGLRLKGSLVVKILRQQHSVHMPVAAALC